MASTLVFAAVIHQHKSRQRFFAMVLCDQFGVGFACAVIGCV
jgi:hypothetical protein